jgi:hypothetical protein
MPLTSQSENIREKTLTPTNIPKQSDGKVIYGNKKALRLKEKSECNVIFYINV